MRVKTLLICNSNMFVPTVLTEVLTHPDDKYLVISDTPNITLFFEFLSLDNVCYIDYRINRRLDILLDKRRLYSTVLKYNIQNLVFFHGEFGGMANWLIKRLSKSIPVYYCKIYESIPFPRCKSLLKVLRMRFREWLYWGTKVDVLEGIKIIPSLPKSFYKNVNAIEISMPVHKDIIAQTVSARMKDFDLDGCFVLLTGTVVYNGLYDEDRYTSFINTLINSLGKENVISKCHPRYSSLFGLEPLLPQIPSFIPGNVIIDCFNYYIGFESTLLVEAAIAGKKAISLIDFLKPEDEMRIKLHDFFNSRLNNRGTIYFPKSFDELKAIVYDAL